jgi:hypothetical protein
MPVVRLLIGGLLCAIGAVWIGQGIGIIGGSFMSGQALWAIVGAVALFIGIVVIRGAVRSRRP